MLPLPPPTGVGYPMRSPAMAPRFLDQNEVQGPRERAHCGPEAHLCIISMQYGVWEYNIYRTLFAALQYVPSQCGGARGRGATRRARAGRAARGAVDARLCILYCRHVREACPNPKFQISPGGG